MKYIIRFFLLILLPVLILSCEKVISFKPVQTEEKYVIEGTITDQPGVCAVLISKTKNFNDDNSFNGVAGAIVSVENNGVTIVLPEISTGVYKTTALNGKPGQTYHLKVNVNGEQFTAASTMPDPVLFRDFYLKPKDFDSLSTTAFVKYKDSAEIKNYYWFELFINGQKQANYGLENDDFTTGQLINSSVVFENTTKNRDKDIKRGDKLSVEMHSIDASVYLYLFSLTGARGSGGNAANPISNIKGGALGYFSAHTVQSKSLIIPLK